MLCSNCNKNSAVMKFVSVINGVKTEYNFCNQCANELGVIAISSFSLGDIFGEAKAQLRCQKCQTTLNDFKKTGYLGCENCYVDLFNDIEPIINRVQKGNTHIGRVPQNFEIQNQEQKNIEIQKKLDQKRKQELEQQLRQAIETENFEQAAVLRDEIKKMR